jgi:hypothetical protein
MRPRGSGRRDHRFAVRNAEVLGGAIRVVSARLDDDVAIVELASNGVGHRFPTGDVFRRLTVTVTALTKDDAVVGGETFHLSRDWDDHRASLHGKRAERFDGDTRLTDAPRAFRVACARAPARIHVTIDWERGASADGDFFDAFERLEIFDADVALRGSDSR